MTEVLLRANGLEVNEVPDGYVIYEAARDRVHYLNKTAAIVFEFCDGQRDADDIVSRVNQLFDLVSSADAEIRGCIDSLLKEGLILIPFQVIARTLSRRIMLVTADTEVFQALRFLECDPEIVGPQPEDLTISVVQHRAYYRIVQNGELLREQLTAKSVMESLHAHLIILSFADHPAAPLVHAASLRRGRCRVLLVGSKGAGKTTLALRLLQDGYEVEGDENVFVTPEGLIARPRGLRVKELAGAFLPGLAQVLEASPCCRDGRGERIYNLDPRRVGAISWRIEKGQVGAVIVLRPNHGGYSSMRPISSLTLMREVMAECGLSSTDRGKAVSAMAKSIGMAKGYDLSLGDPAGAVACVNRLLDDLA